MNDTRAFAVAELLRLGYTGKQVSDLLKLTDPREALALAMEFKRAAATERPTPSEHDPAYDDPLGHGEGRDKPWETEGNDG